MPSYLVTLPDGRKAKVTPPEGTTFTADQARDKALAALGGSKTTPAEPGMGGDQLTGQDPYNPLSVLPTAKAMIDKPQGEPLTLNDRLTGLGNWAGLTAMHGGANLAKPSPFNPSIPGLGFLDKLPNAVRSLFGAKQGVRQAKPTGSSAEILPSIPSDAEELSILNQRVEALLNRGKTKAVVDPVTGKPIEKGTSFVPRQRSEKEWLAGKPRPMVEQRMSSSDILRDRIAEQLVRMNQKKETLAANDAVTAALKARVSPTPPLTQTGSNQRTLDAASELTQGKRPLDLGPAGQRRRAQHAENEHVYEAKEPDQIVRPAKPISGGSDAPISDVLHGGDGPRLPGMFRTLVGKVLSKLPQDYSVWRVHPDSPVITAREAVGMKLAEEMGDIAKSPAWHKMNDPQVWASAESDFIRRMRGGSSFEQAVMAYPPEARELVTRLHSQFAEEQRASMVLNAKRITTEPFYSIPHVTEQMAEEFIGLNKRFTDMASDFSASLGMFEKPRVYGSMEHGIAAGESFVDPRQALLYRLWAGQKLIRTAEFIGQLEKEGVLFRTAEGAKSVSGVAHRVPGVPGAAEWYARSAPEARFILDNMRDPHVMGSLARFTAWGNQWIRTPGLFNPLPHLIKNIGYKYGMSGGSLLKLPKYVAEFRAGGPLVDSFRSVMPFEETGITAHQTVHDLMHAIQPTMAGRVNNVVNYLPRKSSQFLFAKGDISMRYARWRSYVDKGMGYQEAANQTYQDLIRYGLRSEAVDFWKSAPLNFFVPWRTGTAMSLFKNLRHNTVKTALWIGAIDLLREEVYRSTGIWFHAPIDYVEGPLVKSLEHFNPEFWKAAAATAVFGFGGQGTASFYAAIGDSYRKGEISKALLTKLAWGLSSLLDQYGAVDEAKAFAETGDINKLFRLLSMASLGAHDARNYRPRRFGQYLSDEMLSKRKDVKMAEDEQAFREERRRLAEQRHKDHPRPSIIDKINEMEKRNR